MNNIQENGTQMTRIMLIDTEQIRGNENLRVFVSSWQKFYFLFSDEIILINMMIKTHGVTQSHAVSGYILYVFVVKY